MTRSKNDKAFMDHVREECNLYGVKCSLKQSETVKSGGIECSGWFSAYDRELVVAAKRREAFEIFIHEYAHMTQWYNGNDLWDDGLIGMDVVERWLQGARIRNIDKHIAAIRDLELDNEKRAVQLIKDWDLSVDIPAYIRKANAYIHFYNWMRITRRWSNPLNSPYKNPHVLAVMSDKFNMQYERLSKRVHAAFSAGKI